MIQIDTTNCSKNHEALQRSEYKNCPFCGLLFSNEDELIEQITGIRSKNNKNWMELLRLAFRYAPEEAKRILQNISDCDSEINKLTSQLAGGNKK